MKKVKRVSKNVIVDRLKKTNYITIVSHKNPDPDAIGSSLALHLILKKMKIKSSVISYDKVSKTLKHLPEIDKVSFEMTNDKLPKKDVLVVLDSGDMGRIGEVAKITNEYNEVIFIDHHKVADLSGVTMLYNDTTAAATGEIIFDLFGDKYLDKTSATILYAAIATDTGNFVYTNTTTHTHDIASTLLKKGANLLSISSILKVRYDKEDIEELIKVYKSIKIYDDERIASIYINKKNKTSISLTETVMQIASVKIGFVVREESDKFRVSLRSRCDKDVRPIAELFGGGGHKKAAGFEVATTNYKKDELIDLLYKKVKKLLDE